MVEVRKRVCVATGALGGEFPLSRGICRYSREHGPWRIDTHSAADLATQPPTWLAAHFDGLIAAGVYDPNVLARLTMSRRPVVGANSTNCPSGRGGSVTTDNQAIGRLAGEHLLASGYRSFGFYGIGDSWSVQRYEGFRSTVLRHRATLRANMLNADQETWPLWPGASEGDAPAAFLRSLPLPVAVFACDDAMARTLADCCVRLGLRVPEQVAILGVNNMDAYCESSDLTLSSIDANMEQAGYEAAVLLDRMMERDELSGPTVQVRPRRVVDRRSTNPTAFEDDDLAAAMQYIRKHACGHISVAAMCRRISVSRRELEMKFKESLGRSPGEEIRQIRIGRACELLAGTEMPISVVALNCGYGHSQSFCTAFRKVTKMTPRQYRKAHACSARPSTPASDAAG